MDCIKITSRLLLSFGLVLLFSNPGHPIKCWDCNSNTDPRCADPFDNETVFMKNCAHEPALAHYPGVKATMCRKIRQKINGKWRYYRDCAYLGEPGIGGDDKGMGADERYCLMRTGTHNIFIEICNCVSKDGCNTASGVEVYTVLMFVGSLLFAYYMN